MEKAYSPEFVGIIFLTVFFLCVLVVISIRKIKTNVGFWAQYGMILFAVIYLLFIILLIVIHPEPISIFWVGVGSLFYTFVSAMIAE